MKTVDVYVFAIAASIVFLNGCSAGPQFINAKQLDSARIVGPGISAKATEEVGRGHISIKSVDGLAVDFEASEPLAATWNSFLFSKKALYVTPGVHVMLLDIKENDPAPGVQGPPSAREYNDITTSGTQAFINAEFMANHVYRFSADIDGGSFHVSLWDETGGGVSPKRVGFWSFDGNSQYHRG